jgi:hypothetical protein
MLGMGLTLNDSIASPSRAKSEIEIPRRDLEKSIVTLEKKETIRTCTHTHTHTHARIHTYIHKHRCTCRYTNESRRTNKEKGQCHKRNIANSNSSSDIHSTILPILMAGSIMLQLIDNRFIQWSTCGNNCV